MKKIDESQDSPCEKYDVRLSFRLARIAEKVGGGNLSEGIRRCIERATKDLPFMATLPKRASD